MAPTERERLVLFAPGAVCALGTHPAEIAITVRAGCRRFDRARNLPRHRDGAPAVVARLSLLDDTLTGAQRMLALGHAAAAQSLARLSKALATANRPQPLIPVLMSMPPSRPGLSTETIEQIVHSLLDRLTSVSPQESRYFQLGHDGFIAALQHAAMLLHAHQADYCLVGGLDSAADLDYLHWLETLGRLKSDENPFGLMPGEGAAFFVMARQSSVRALGNTAGPGMVVTALGQHHEPQPWYEGEASMALGLTRAIAACVAEERSAAVCYSDLNGEIWRSSEWDLAHFRNGGAFGHPLDLRHPAESWGDVGAASAALISMLALMEFSDGLHDHRSALVCASSDTQPSRSACLLSYPPATSGANT